MTGGEPGFVAPTSLEDAVAEAGRDGALIVAGGTSVVRQLTSGLVQPKHLVHLGRVAVLDTVTKVGDRVEIGAAVTPRRLAASALVGTELPVLALTAGRLGNPRVRAVATVGGAVVLGDARQDLLPVLLALGTTVLVRRGAHERAVALADFLDGAGTRPGELVTGVRIPVDRGRRTAYLTYQPGSAVDHPVVSVAASLDVDAEGIVADAAIAIGGVGRTPALAGAAQHLLRGQRLTPDVLAAAGAAAAAAVRPVADRRGSVGYQRAMVAEWVPRAVTAAALS